MTTHRQWWLQTQAVHDDSVLSTTAAASVTKDDTTARQPPYQTSSFAYHRHQ